MEEPAQGQAEQPAPGRQCGSPRRGALPARPVPPRPWTYPHPHRAPRPRALPPRLRAGEGCRGAGGGSPTSHSPSEGAGPRRPRPGCAFDRCPSPRRGGGERARPHAAERPPPGPRVAPAGGRRPQRAAGPCGLAAAPWGRAAAPAPSSSSCGKSGRRGGGRPGDRVGAASASVTTPAGRRAPAPQTLLLWVRRRLWSRPLLAGSHRGRHKATSAAHHLDTR